MLSPGTVIGGRYRLVRLLGEGGMGVVWAAVNDAFGREVAIKVMLREVASADPTAIERFFTEARICGTIRHPGIVDVLDVGRADDGAPFLVMELLDGESLDTVLHRRGTLRPLEILPFVRDVARTLALAHEKGVIHRDIKPGNLFLHRLPTGQVVAKLLDFGVSKFTNPAAKQTKTRTGIVVGSPAYMSPEQAAGRLELDPRSDVYALGVILYEALSGRLPFLEENYNALIIDIAVREPPPLGSIAPGLPKPVLELVKAAMMHDRDARLASANALADAIESTLAALGASRSLGLPDPATLEGSGAGAPRGAMSQTSSALTTNARNKPKRSSSVLAIAGGVTFVIALGGALAWMKLFPRATPAVASAAPPMESAALALTASAAIPPATATSSASAPAPEPSASAEAPVPTSSAKAASSAAAPPRKPNARPGGKQKGGVWSYD
jgi:serine/threonine-protein kinase